MGVYLSECSILFVDFNSAVFCQSTHERDEVILSVSHGGDSLLHGVYLKSQLVVLLLHFLNWFLIVKEEAMHNGGVIILTMVKA